MNSEFIIFIFLIAAVFFAVDIIRRSVNVFLIIGHKDATEKQMRQLAKAKQPHVTVLVYGNKNSRATEDTIKSVRRSKYFAYDVAIAYTNLPITRSYRAAYRRSRRGSIVVCLQAGEQIDPLFLKRAVLSRNEAARWWVVTRKEYQSQGIVGIASELQQALWGDTYSIEVCASSALRKSDPLIRRIRGVPLIVVGLLTGGTILAVLYGGIHALWYAWLLFTSYLFLVILLQESHTFNNRWRVILATPSAFFFMPIASFFEGIFQVGTRK